MCLILLFFLMECVPHIFKNQVETTYQKLILECFLAPGVHSCKQRKKVTELSVNIFSVRDVNASLIFHHFQNKKWYSNSCKDPHPLQIIRIITLTLITFKFLYKLVCSKFKRCLLSSYAATCIYYVLTLSIVK